MRYDEFAQLIKGQLSPQKGQIAELKEMVSCYPYFSQVRLLLAKVMLDSEELQAGYFVEKATMYVSDRREAFYYLYPEKRLSNEQVKVNRVPKYSGSYFDILNYVESEEGDAKESLKNLASRLKSAREMVDNPVEAKIKFNVRGGVKPTPQVRVEVPSYFAESRVNERLNGEITEEQVKKLIREKRYQLAIEMLRKLSLINPKKSVYFADQIRFLEKVVLNSKK